ncbi:iron-containing alcohol dehydrogenase [Pelagibaculum spongiae]|uniref:NADH-dependent alcohol dehydrogenase n=1 Tax=Pelagibaculum spongiae TaxID=2080658 RepID=A0A2V1GVQ5_9GAMM|nr:iron-containing alcohol dehydrogenase [Pelagibaculum spongiae]PVZ70475.1 NADH-dependent alcohol dehydrogenase [Pelagibaculum spongiae]
MNNFQFYNPTRILFGEGQIASVADNIPQGSRVLFAYGGGSIHKNGVYDQVRKSLEQFEFFEFSGIEVNPSFVTLMEATSLVQRENIDFILAVGGGSVVDGAKFIAAASVYEGDAWNIMTKPNQVKQALPLGCVLTLPATGSESNGNSVVTRYETHEKLGFFSPLVFPRFAVLDPTTTLTLPQRQVSNGVVDAFVHVIEQYLTYPVNAPIQDGFSESLLKTLISEGPKALANPNDITVRSNIMWSATLALNGLISSGVPQDWATHMIGHELTALHGVDHAVSLAIILPPLLQEMTEEKHAKLLQYATNVWNIDSGDDASKIALAIEKTRDFFELMQIKTRLSDYQIGKHDIPEILGQLEKHNMMQLGERGQVTLDRTQKILLNAL